MKRLLVCALLGSALAMPAFAAKKSGDTATDFAAPASLAGKEFKFSLKDALAKGPAVVYFYPAAYTRGCNIEAHTFAENADKFAAAGATIIGVSHDSIAKLNEFSSDPEYCAGKFPVASDADGTIASSFDIKVTKRDGAKDMKGGEITATAERTTFVITPDHKVVATFSSADDGVSPEDHVNKSLALVQELKAKKK